MPSSSNKFSFTLSCFAGEHVHNQWWKGTHDLAWPSVCLFWVLRILIISHSSRAIFFVNFSCEFAIRCAIVEIYSIVGYIPASMKAAHGSMPCVQAFRVTIRFYAFTRHLSYNPGFQYLVMLSMVVWLFKTKGFRLVGRTLKLQTHHCELVWRDVTIHPKSNRRQSIDIQSIVYLNLSA